MPIYEYKCLGCGAHVEKMQKVSDEPLKTCESCGGDLKKQVSRTGFQFKGEGWYVTDYAGKKSEKSEKSESGEKSSGSESTDKGASASNKGNDTTKGSKTDTASKKD